MQLRYARDGTIRALGSMHLRYVTDGTLRALGSMHLRYMTDGRLRACSMLLRYVTDWTAYRSGTGDFMKKVPTATCGLRDR